MFDNIVANNNINFNDLEKKIYKFVCNLGCCILKTLLENYDNKIKENRDKKIFRHKGYKVNSIKTVLGIVTYKRAIYEYTENENTKRECKKYIFLLDELVNITAIGKISANLVEKILSTAVETNSYRDASSQLMENINIAISHEAVRNVVIQEGMKIIEKEQEEIKLDSKDKLIPGIKEIPVLFEEADGLWINLQGKDREEQKAKNKKACEKQGKEYKEQSSVKSELKLHVSYEGWKKDDTRHTLVEKMYIVGFMSSKEMKQRRDARIFQKYDVDKIQLRILNGDGARWINKLATKDTIRQKDNFHIHQEIIRDIPEEENRRIIEKLIAERRYEEVPIFLEYLKYECGGEEKYVKKIEKLESYLNEGLPRYQDILEEKNIEMPEAPDGIEYRNPGIMESQIFTVLSKRFKSGRLSFGKIGATCLAKICASKVENKGVIELEKLEQLDKKEKEEIRKIKTKRDKQNMTESIRMKEANRSEEHEITDEIVKTIFYSIKPMGPEDAKLLLEDQPQNKFLTFVNIETGKVNVIYRLKDSKNFGLIEPEE